MENWIAQQMNQIVCQWDHAIEKNYPQFAHMWQDPQAHYTALMTEWNTLKAVELLPWDKYLNSANLNIVDLGAGSGWLSIFLSKFPNVQKIYTIDSCEFLLTEMLPAICKLMEGNLNKIQPIKGLFNPILLSDNSVDLVVESSAFHHSDSVGDIIQEIHRVLKPGGWLIILNEHPLSQWKYMQMLLKHFASILLNSVRKKSPSIVCQITHNGILYDPKLGDRVFPKWYWENILHSNHFKIEEFLLTSLPPAVSQPKASKLAHFICRK
jgi:SAM-dependent methyltransferase